MQVIKSEYAEIEKNVIAWMRQCGIQQLELDPEPDDHWYHENPNY